MARYFKATAYWMLCAAFVILPTTFFTSCQEGGDAGDLLGQWRLTDSETRYIAFSGSVTVFRSIGEGEIWGNFQHKGDSLFIQCFSINGTPADTVIVEKGYGFKPFSNIRVKIERLDSDRLMLSKDGQKWDLNK